MTTSRVEPLTWDSDFFGFSVGRVIGTRFTSLEEAMATAGEARHRRFRCVYFLADAADSPTWAAATAAGFTPIDIRVELSRNATVEDAPANLAVPGDEPALRSIIGSDLFAGSRFYRDPHFGSDQARRLFEIWTGRGLRDDGWFTAVERADGGIAGFVTARIRHDHNGSIELVAVAESARGRGVGGRVLSAAMSELIRRGTRDITVVTQGSNLAALRLYADHGFRVTSCGLWFHLWL
jgi:dTDP-4-amino-4,6-dideoxy-D-galactose acyltransferase